MKIAFDHQIFSIQTYGGVSKYFTHLFKELIKDGELNIKVFANFHKNNYLNEIPNRYVKGKKIEGLFSRTFFLESINLVQNFSNIKYWKPEIIHKTWYKSSSKLKGVKSITTVHDLIHEKFPNYFPFYDLTSKQKRKAILETDHILAISENTKRDIIEIFDVEKEKISVIHHGVDKDFFRIKSDESDLNLKPYLLYVGARNGYKNFDNFVKSYSISKNLKFDVNIVTFGGGKFSKDEKILFKDLKIPGNRIFNLNGDDKLLRNLYQNALALVYPSLYEGFGMPLLEAMASGCPVIASNKSSIPEIVNEAALLFDPLESDEILHSIEKVTYDDSLKSELTKLGFENIKRFSWKHCASKTKDIYQKLTTGKI